MPGPPLCASAITPDMSIVLAGHVIGPRPQSEDPVLAAVVRAARHEEVSAAALDQLTLPARPELVALRLHHDVRHAARRTRR